MYDVCVSPYAPTMHAPNLGPPGSETPGVPATPFPALMAAVTLYPSNDGQPPLSHVKTGMRTTSKNCTCEHYRCVNVETVLLVHTHRDAEKLGPAAMQRKHSVKCGNRLAHATGQREVQRNQQNQPYNDERGRFPIGEGRDERRKDDPRTPSRRKYVKYPETRKLTPYMYHCRKKKR